MAQCIITRKSGGGLKIKIREIQINKNARNKPSSAFEINAPLKFRNESTTGSTSPVNGATLKIEYRDNGDWAQYDINEDTVNNVKNMDFSFVNSTYPGCLRWQYNRNNSCEFTTNESHKYWRFTMVGGGDKYSQNFVVEGANYEVISDSETIS